MVVVYREFFLNSLHHAMHFSVDLRFNEDGHCKPVVIFIHGFKGFKDWGPFNLIADQFSQGDFVFVKLNLSHNGTTLRHPKKLVDLEAFAQNNFSIEMDDISVLLDYLFCEKENTFIKECDLTRVFLIGHSRGGSLAILKACEDKRISAVAAWSAVSDYSSMWTEKAMALWKKKKMIYVLNKGTRQYLPIYYQIVENFYRYRERLDISIAIENLDIPLMIIHAKDDTSVPIRMAYELKHWYKRAKLLILDRGGHTLDAYHPYKRKKLPKALSKVVCETKSFFTGVDLLK